MASEIIVNTIKAPTSGANANKVLIPSGVTLDTSGGSLKPSSKQIVQEVFDYGAQTFTSSGSSWVSTPVSATITPQYSDSIIRVFATCAVWRSSGNGYFGVKVINTGGNTSTPAIWGDGYNATGGGISWDTPYQFEFIAGSTSAITSTFYVHPNGGGTWFPNNGPTHSPNYRWTMRLLEVRP